MLATLLTLAAAQAMPMPMPAVCAAPGKLPPELAGWASPRPAAAATVQEELGEATLTLGAGARVTLSPTPRVAYPVQPAHPGTASTNGGLFAFAVTEAGSYRVALSGPAWIDMVADGKPVGSAAHGPDCTGIRKQVDFALKPGRYLLQVSGASDPVLELLVARLPG